MNLQETLALLEALRASGVTRFKSLEHDIEFNGSQSIGQKQVATILDQRVPEPAPIMSPEQLAKEEDARKKIQDMIKTVNMTPDQLARAMFPEDI